MGVGEGGGGGGDWFGWKLNSVGTFGLRFPPSLTYTDGFNALLLYDLLNSSYLFVVIITQYMFRYV